jgi:hypothetical protein
VRWLWGIGGLLALVAGLAALLVPVLPTSPFLVLAAACWMRASPALERWLVEHRWLGAPIRDWRAGRGVRRGVQMSLLALTAAGMSLALWRLPDDANWTRAAIIGGGFLTAWFFLALPVRKD